MSMDKHPIALAQLRRVPRPFSWVDQRLVRERSIDRLSHEAYALYLLVVTVADAQGLRSYAERSLCQRLSMSEAQWRPARQALITQRLLAYRYRLYQVWAVGTSPRETLPAAPDDAVDLQAVFTRLGEGLS
jgi:hypothetical protein